MKVTIVPIVIGAFGTVTKGLKGTGGFGGWRTSGDHPDYSIIEIGQYTGKSPGRPEETCCHSDFIERPSANDGVNNSQGAK